MELGSGQFLHTEILEKIHAVWGDATNPLGRQAFALTCKAAYRIFGRLSPGIIDLLPAKWRFLLSDNDPVAYYYYPLIYRILREAPSWLYEWEVARGKRVYKDRPMVLIVTFHSPGDATYHYSIKNNNRGWKINTRWGMSFNKLHAAMSRLVKQ
jgi:hypothetical protein